MGSGGGGIQNLCYAIFWLLVLIFLALWLAGICSFLYIFISIFTPCINSLNGFADLLMKGINLPHKCADNMVHGRSYNSF